ncbi:T200A protein, partial [Dromaius novaehollandiae]|nr:T200A protein [Dromaius novaehollandiae]
MTAERAEANGPMRSQDAVENKPPAPAAPSRRRRRRRRRKPPPEVAVKGQLRMRSPSGVFVMVGISVVLVGMTIAVVGYWPHRAGAGAGSGNVSSPGDVRKEVAHARHFPHSEKLKLIGPVIMGIGLFIFICANTMLYENRDTETRLLMQKGLYAMTAGLPEAAGTEDKFCQRRAGQPALKASAECVEGCYEVDPTSGVLQSCPGPGSKWADCYGPNRLQTTAQLLHHRGVSPSVSLLSVRSGCGGSAEGNLNLSFSPGAESLALSPELQPHNPGHSQSLDLGRPGVLLVAPIKDRKNRSWPRLDHLSLVGYAKLESTGESSDRL